MILFAYLFTAEIYSLTMTNRLFLKIIFLALFSALFSGCSSYGVITNEPQTHAQAADKNYSMLSVIKSKPQGDITLVLAFSGGGTRAAALAYGVLEQLDEISLNNNKSLLDEVDIISAVSGGSFTAAYYGLYGKKTFRTFKDNILLTDIESELLSGILNPFAWFKKTGRTQQAIDYYNLKLFAGKTFADLNKPGRPLILINASDLANGVRFSFIQEYFDLICSDIKDLPIGKAVAASSAVPILFNPVVLQNYQHCHNGAENRLANARQFVKNNEELSEAIRGLSDYVETDYPYLHLVDGGITDNLGLRAIYEAIELSGGPQQFLQRVNKSRTKHIVVISVDASTKTGSAIKQSNKIPTGLQSINAMTDIQIHRYNTATKDLFKESMDAWSQSLSTPEQIVRPHFIQLHFGQLPTTQLKAQFNMIPTSLTLTKEEINMLIAAGKQLLIDNIDFQLLLREIDNQTP